MAKRDRPEYSIWHGMKDRCLNPASQNFHHYGGRGIKVCPRWINSFDNFVSDVGTRPSLKHSIDRINNDGNYEPSNVRWALPWEQVNNRRPSIAYRKSLSTKFPLNPQREKLVRDDDLRSMIADLVKESGSLRSAAKAIGVSASYLSAVMAEKNPPSAKVAEFFGYEENKAKWVRDNR